MGSNVEIGGLSDVALLEKLCSSREDDLPFYKEFLKRFLPDLKEECRQKCKARGLDKSFADEIAHKVLERVRQYKSFKIDEIHIPDIRRAILVYLYRIASNLIYDHFNLEKRQNIVHRNYFDDLREEAQFAIDAKGLKVQKELSQEILKKLNKKEQAVLLADMEHKRHQKYLPDDITLELAQQLKVKPDTIRKIRQRAIQKLLKAFDEINKA